MEDNKTVVQYLNQWSNSALIDLARKARAKEVNIVDAESGNSLMQLAIQETKDNEDLMPCLLNLAHLDHQNYKGETALHIAVNLHKVHLARLLIFAGINVNLTDNKGETPLFGVARDITGESGRRLVSEMLRKGAEVGLENFEGKSAVFVAVEKDNTSFVEEFTERGLCLRLRDEEGNTLLHRALVMPHINYKMIYLLIYRNRVDEYVKNNAGYTPLHVAAENYVDAIRACKILLCCGAKVNEQTNEGQTPLHLALESGNKNIAHFLLQKGASPNVKDHIKSNNTPLHYAVKDPDLFLPVIRTMLDKGAAVDTMNSQHKTPYDLAVGLAVHALESHIIKLRAANISVNINNEFSLPRHKEEERTYRLELNRIKATTIFENFTLNQVLMNVRRPLYLTNFTLLSKISVRMHSSACKKEFPNYFHILRNTYLESRERCYALLWALFLLDMVKWHPWSTMLSTELKIEILSYLSKEELSNLCTSYTSKEF